MRLWLIGTLAGGMLAYAVLEAQTPAASQGTVATPSAADPQGQRYTRQRDTGASAGRCQWRQQLAGKRRKL